MLGQLPERLRQPAPFVVEAVPLFRGHAVETVLDVGCGTGRNAVFLAKQGFRVVGIDTSKEALKMAKTWLKAGKAEDFDVVRASMTVLPFLNGSFGAAVSVSVIHRAV
jgi:ubiquinone/menaquinone biosynthesis C-methylase UbiE